MSDQAALFQELKTIRDFIRWGASRFHQAGLYFGHGTDNAWDEAVVLVSHALFLPPEIDNRSLDARLTTEEKEAVLLLLERRLTERLPAPYITGQAWFAGLQFHVDQRVMIPRSPIAELIEKQFAPWLVSTPSDILDLCTGSGCIGIACAYAFPEARVTLSDISYEALSVAEKNVVEHDLDNRVATVQSDLFESLKDRVFDLIICNPPYVDAEDLNSMPEEYQHEPRLALASGEDGLDFTRRLLHHAASYLRPNGFVLVEVGNSWQALEQVYPKHPFTWMEFERGGQGVFLITRDELESGGF